MNHTLLTINLRDYSLDPYDYFPKIHQAIVDKLAETEIATIPLETLTLELVPAEDQYLDDVTFYNAIVSVQCNGQQYQQSSFYAPIQDDRVFLGRIEANTFIELFNQILQDQSSPYRLHTTVVRSRASFQVIAKEQNSSSNSDVKNLLRAKGLLQ